MTTEEKIKLNAIERDILGAEQHDSVAFVNDVIKSSINEGWLADRLEHHGMASKLGIPLY